ncbi:LuxR C-terminal-related transcriptional regulator [Kutzneria sp. CA-103260]|uniref:LuxR C-terminal-related transcriptional regulator n=1 Tax=Kutzneria sp. CA-103260 TaxID=2802641 RepID=UPI001BA7F9B7|nr:response regulator transcription factor [Kutzneria sp. CA-103260]QUQ65170.1 two-component system response regulator [Kutzneria sp. CA-103260]
MTHPAHREPPPFSARRPGTLLESPARVAPAPVTVLLADAQPVARRRVRSMLERSGGVTVVGEATTAAEMFAEVAWHRPDILVVDPHQFGRIAAEDVIGHVARIAPRTRVLVVTAIADDAAVRAAFHAGARGYLVAADADADQVLRGVEVVSNGEVIVGRSVAGRLAALLSSRGDHAPYPFPQLTVREQQVLERIAAGKSNLAIARDLALAPKTISNRVSSVLGKLGVTDRAQAIVLARDAGLGRG